MVIFIGCVFQLLEEEVGRLVAGSHAYQCHPMRGRASSLDDEGWVHGTASLCELRLLPWAGGDGFPSACLLVPVVAVRVDPVERRGYSLPEVERCLYLDIVSILSF